MKKKLKDTKFIIGIVILLFCTFSLSLNNIIKAAETLPEVEVKVNYTGIKTAEANGDVKRNENVLTRISDALLKGQELYTYDSVTANVFEGSDPGDTMYGDMGCVIKDANGERIQSLDIDVQMFINVSKETVAEGLYNDYSFYQNLFTESEFKETITSSDDILSAKYGTYLTKKYNLKIVFYEGGTFSVEIPPNMPDNYVLAITAIEDPLTGEKVDISEYFRLFIALGDGSNSIPGGGQDQEPEEEIDPSEDDGHRYYSTTSSLTNYQDLDPAISAKIFSEKYDAEKSIPTSENILYQLTADNALYNITTRATTVDAGVKNITIILTATYPQKHTRITYNESGDKIVKSWTTTEKISRTVTTDYAYALPTLTLYDVPTSNIFPVQSGSLQTDNAGNTLSSGTIGLTGSQTKRAQVLKVTAQMPNVNDTEYRNLGYFSSYSAALKALNNNDGSSVKNRIKTAVHAAVGFTGNINYGYYGLSVTTKTHNGVKPVVAKTTGMSSGLIPSSYPNGLYISSGSVSYGGQTFAANPNNIIIHTPVVNNAYISSTSEFINQKINIDSNRKYLMLDEQFTIYIPDSGTHNNLKGYGTRNYNSKQGVTQFQTTWGKIKDVKLPFDVYLHYTKNGTAYKYFVKANTWLSESGAASVISLASNSYTFTIPVWVTEQTYDIETRVIAENAIDATMYGKVEAGKNAFGDNYVATKTIPVEIIGKIYDLRVSASNDPGWSSIYSWKNSTNYITSDEFPFGSEGQNKITQYKYAPKLGYTFVFDFKTKGTKSNNIDISVQPEGFYFVSRDGKTTQEVDLYYNTTTKSNIKISTSDTNTKLSVNLRESFMKVAAQEFVDSARIYNSKYNYSLNVNVGTFAKMNLPQNLRLCYNNFEEYVNALYGKGSTISSISSNAGSKDTVIGSVGHWYAGYKLPASTKAIEKGADINTAVKNNSFLKDGYIVVKFDIKTKYQNNSGNYEYLQYMGPEALNEGGDNTGTLIQDWTKEETQTITLPNGNTAQVPVGTMAIYDASLRSSNDSEMGGTH